MLKQHEITGTELLPLAICIATALFQWGQNTYKQFYIKADEN